MSALAVLATVVFTVAGKGVVTDAGVGRRPCPNGRYVVAIAGGGSSSICVVAISKRDAPGYVVRRITQRVVATDRLRGGTIVSRQSQTFSFRRDGRVASVGCRGTVVGGTGRFAGSRGTIVGRGRQVDGRLRVRFVVSLTRR